MRKKIIEPDNQVQEDSIFRIAAVLVVLALSTIILKTLDFIFVPFSLALIICYAMGIPLDFLARFRLPAYVRILFVVSAILLLGALLGGLLRANIIEFQKQMPELEQRFWEYSTLLLERFDLTRSDLSVMASAFMRNIQPDGLKPLGNMVKLMGGSFFGFVGNCFWVLLFIIFILAEKEGLAERLARSLGREQAEIINAAGDRINKAVQSYLGLKTLVSLITGVLATLVLWLFDVPFALLWGVLTFLLNFIPNIGSLIASVPPVAVTLFQSGSLITTLIVGLLLTTIQVVVGNFLEPKIMGKGLNLSPLVVLLALIFWGWMWGVSGMLLAVPLTAAAKIAMEQTEATRSFATLLGSK